MSEFAIDLNQALQIARAFNLAFNNAFMYGGMHQTTKDSAATFYGVLQPLLNETSLISISVEKDSIFLENHCVDKLVSVQRINNRFKKAGVQSVSFSREASLENVQALFYLIGSLSEFKTIESMQAYLNSEGISGIKINYVTYRRVTLDDTIVSKELLSESQQLMNNQQDHVTESTFQTNPGAVLKEFSELLSLRNSTEQNPAAETAVTSSSRLSASDSDRLISSQIRSISKQFTLSEESDDGTTLTTAEMLETVYKIKENLLENIRLQKETGKLNSTDELAISEINQLSYQVIVRLIKDEYRVDQKISVKRLAQIIRRMLPDIKELKYLLPQLKDGLFAEGMSPSDYLSLVKELNKELDSDGLIQILAEASDQIGLTLNELIEGIKAAPEESARLIVLAAELNKGGVKSDDQQMSAVLSDYIEKVSRALALQSPEAAVPGGGVLLKSAVTRIEREILERLKSQDISADTVSDIAQKLAAQFSETLSILKVDWLKKSINSSKDLGEETLLSIIEQISEQGQYDEGVTEEVRSVLISKGFSGDKIDNMVKKAHLLADAAVTHKIEIPEGAYNATTMAFFMNLEIKRNCRYNSPFSTILISYDKIVDLRTFTIIDLTPDVNIQLTNQSLNILKELKRDLDVVGLFAKGSIFIPFMILPMTDISGVLFVKKRIEKELPCHEFIVNGITVHVEPVVTVSSFDRNLTPDKGSYAKSIYLLHRQPRLQ